jgi:hypothetical protein
MLTNVGRDDFNKEIEDVPTATDAGCDVDEFKRFQDDVLKAIEPLQQGIVLHASMYPARQPLERRADLDLRALVASETLPTASSKSKHGASFCAGAMTGALGAVIGMAALAAGHLSVADLLNSQFVERFFVQSRHVADALPSTFADRFALQRKAAELSSRGMSDDGPGQIIDEPLPAPTQMTVSEKTPPAADLPPSVAVVTDGKVEAPRAVDDALASLEKPVTHKSKAQSATPPKADLERPRKLAKTVTKRDKPKGRSTRSGFNTGMASKALRHRRTTAKDAILEPGSATTPELNNEQDEWLSQTFRRRTF